MGIAAAPSELRDALERASPEARADFLVALYFAAASQGLISGVRLDPEVDRALREFGPRAGLAQELSPEAQRDRLLQYFAQHPLPLELVRLLGELAREEALRPSAGAEQNRARALIGADRALPGAPAPQRTGGLMAQLVAANYSKKE